MSLSRLAVKRPIATIMVLLAVLILGFLIYPRLPLNLLPQMNYPMAVVVTQYPEAGPQEIENMITRPMEEMVGTTAGIENISSRSYEELSMVMVEFSWGTDMDFASLEMRERIDTVRENLPEGAESPQVVKVDPSLMPVMFVSVGLEEAEGEHRDLIDLEHLVSNQVVNRLKRIDGVSSVELSGVGEREIRVDLNEDQMEKYDLNSQEVYGILSGQNINVPGGRIVEEEQELLVRSVSEFSSLDELEETTVGINTPDFPGETSNGLNDSFSSGDELPADQNPEVSTEFSTDRRQGEEFSGDYGEPVYLDDIADIRDEYQRESLVRLNGDKALGLIIQKQSDANTVQVTRNINEELAKIQGEYQELNLVPTWNQGNFIEEVLSMVQQNAVLGGFLAALVLFVFLRNYKSTLIVAISIPASILATFPLAYFTGLSLNIMTLSGLALGIGMLVDNSVVVLENIFRHVEQGKQIKEAAITGTEEVSSPIIASTLTTIAVFLPVFLLEDLAGIIFADLSYMVVFSLAMSLFTALTVIPVLSVLLIGHNQAISKFIPIENLKKRYKKSLHYLSKKGKYVLGGAIILMVISFTLLPNLGGEFLPPITRSEFTVDVRLPPGTHLETTEEVVTEVEQYLLDEEEVDSVYATIGERASQREGAGYTQRTPHRGELMVILETDEQEKLAQQVESEFYDHDQASISASEMEGDLEMGGDAIEIDLIGPELDTLRELSQDIANEVSELEVVSNVSRNLPTPRPELQVSPKDEQSMLKGITPIQMSQDLETDLTGRRATIFREDGREIPIVLGYFSEGPESTEEIKEKYQDIATVEKEPGPTVINRQDGQRYVTISADSETRDVRGAVNSIQDRLDNVDIPQGYRLNYGGAYEDMWSSYLELGGALALSLLLVFMVMAGQFESLRYPLVIMVSIPFSFVGVILALYILNDTLNVASIMGVIILSGLVVNNAIVLVDCIKREDSVLEGASLRLRPILMTTITTLLALIPMAIAVGPGSEIQNSLAFSLIGGLFSATLLTLVILPLVIIWIKSRFNLD